MTHPVTQSDTIEMAYPTGLPVHQDDITPLTLPWAQGLSRAQRLAHLIPVIKTRLVKTVEIEPKLFDSIRFTLEKL